MNGIKGKNKDIYLKKNGISTLSKSGKRTDISYKNIKRVEYLFAQEKQNGYIVFSTLTNQNEKIDFSQKSNDEILNLIESLQKNFSDLDFEEHEEPMYKSGLSIFLLISFIVGALYMVYSLFYWTGAVGSQDSIWEQIGAGIATALVVPHLICTAVAVLFNGLGLFLRRKGFALTGAILYTVAVVLFPVYFMFVTIEAVLSYVGFAKMPK